MSGATFSPEVQEILDRVKNGTPKPKRQKPPKAGGAGVLEPKVRRTTNQIYNYDLIASLYTTLSMSVRDIADYVGCNRSTVTLALNAAGIDPQERAEKALQPKEMCKRGLHSMDDHAVAKGKVRTCGPCQTMVRAIARYRRAGKPLTPEMIEFQEL